LTRGRQGRLRSRWHGLSHALVIAIGWVGFGWLWWRVGRYSWDSHDLRLLVLVATLFFPLVTEAWVLHNLNIHRRLGPRRSVRTVAYLAQDIHGRPVAADWDQLQSARHVDIDCSGEVKLYTAALPG
jgi:hypothetical protein